MVFLNRNEADNRLAIALEAWKGRHPLILVRSRAGAPNTKRPAAMRAFFMPEP
jgi:hypothetical protein